VRLTIFLILVVLAAACGGESVSVSEPDRNGGHQPRQWKLPDRLREISGLALNTEERLFGITDEEAIVYELDYSSGRLVKAFALGDPVVPGDFEGLAYLQDRFWLMTSRGELYSAREGSDGERVAYEKFDTGLEHECEFEGLAEIESRNTLALLCKDALKKGGLRVFEWDVDEGGLVEGGGFRLPKKDIEDAIDRKSVSPSGLVMHPQTGTWWVIAARQHALFELDADGNFMSVIMMLDEDRHRQAEGIEVTSDGRLLIADEGQNGRARLAVYGPETGNNKN
jgi:uncharacterized protein YjiK